MQPNPDSIRWNQKYSDIGPESFGLSPASWLTQHLSLLDVLPKGPALDIACGNGRNSFYLGELGFTVDAVDISGVAIDWVKAEASKRRLPVKAYCMDVAERAFPQCQGQSPCYYQLIIVFNFLERRLFSRILNALAPGGLLIYETMYQDEIEVLGSKINPDYVLGYNELLHAFGDFRILAYREQVVEINSNGKQKALAALVARK